MRHWVMVSEPDARAIHHLAAAGTTHGNGARNYRARNPIRDGMEAGDQVCHHSRLRPSRVEGLA